MAQFSAGVEIFYIFYRTVSDVHSTCYPKGTGRNFTLIKAVGAWNTNLYWVSKWRAYWTVSLLTCKPSWRSTELGAGNSLPLTLCCCGKPSRWYSEHAIF